MSVRSDSPPVGEGTSVLPLFWLAKCPAVFPAAWNTMYSVSPKLANELAAVHMAELVTISTGLPGGMMP
jgi:hypothetical protein